ncbi:MAG: hypothetical protein MSG64_11265 [Pyrinomonadaceae bacterium MAG19_C2-C3]|nr:hypothetical protein [Pyrinomonadaceae bacterium MAG19_C2-C3]
MQGFSIFGIAEDPLRRSLHAALNQLGIPFEERLSKIRLLDTNADLQINVQGRMGVAAINIKPKSEGATLERIMTVLREDFASSSGIANLTTGYFQIALGLLLLAMSVGLFSLQQSSNARMKEYERQSEVYNSTYTRTP